MIHGMSLSAPPSEGPSGPRVFLSGRRRIAVGVVAVAVLAAATAFVLGGDGKPAGRAPDPGLVTNGALFGVHTKVDSRSDEAEKQAVEALEDHLGRKIDIDHHFYPWDKEFPTEIERWNLDNGRLPMISWNGRDVFAGDIAAGEHDPLIMDRAARVKELDGTVLIRWFWEMDGNKKAEWAGAPADYIAAWRHIHDTFDEQGATNVDWVWCPNASAFRDGEAQAFYPGDGYVDWICADGYNWAPGREGDEWRSFRDIFDGFYAWAAEQGKPIMIGEYGVQEGAPGEKAAWIADLQATVKTEFPLIRALVYFNANQDYDWRMNTSETAYAAFKEMANDPFFSAGLNQLLPE